MSEPNEHLRIDELPAFAIISDDSDQVEIRSLRNGTELLIDLKDIQLLTASLRNLHQSRPQP